MRDSSLRRPAVRMSKFGHLNLRNVSFLRFAGRFAGVASPKQKAALVVMPGRLAVVLNGGDGLFVLRLLAELVQVSGRLSFLLERQSLLPQLLLNQVLLIFQVAVLERYELILGVQLLGQVACRFAVVQRLDLRAVVVLVFWVGEQVGTYVCAEQTRRFAQMAVLADVVQLGGLLVVVARILDQNAQTIAATHRRRTTEADQTDRVLRSVYTVLIVVVVRVRNLFGYDYLLLLLQSA